jgi:hypothetical protein
MQPDQRARVSAAMRDAGRLCRPGPVRGAATSLTRPGSGIGPAWLLAGRQPAPASRGAAEAGGRSCTRGHGAGSECCARLRRIRHAANWLEQEAQDPWARSLRRP